MAIHVLKSLRVGNYYFRITSTQLMCTELGRFSLTNHSGLGNRLSKAGFKPLQVKQVYALLRSA